jgi:hypothetical protein
MNTMSDNRFRSLITAAITLLLPLAGFAQTVIGSWQDTDGDGWIDWGNGESIVAPTNTGTYSFSAGAVSGFSQSLQVTDAGFNQNLAIRLQDSGFVDNFMQNTRLSFTFSVPAWTNGGYSELFQLAVNAEGYGFVAQTFDANWSSTGDTANNDGTKPRFFFFDGSPARSQTVTFDYSAILANTNLPANPSYVELIFTFNNGGGAPAFFYMNEVTLSPAPSPTLVVNDFDDSSQVLTNNGSPWVRWFGVAADLPTTEWDPSDANGDTNSGSMKINAFYPDSGFFADGTGPQFVVYNDAWFDDAFGSTNGMPGYGNTTTNYVATNVAFDLRFDPISAYDTNSGNWPTIEVGARANFTYSSQPVFGTATIPQSNLNWVHFDIPIGPSSDWANIHAIFFKHWNNTLSGEVDLYVDNIEVTLGEVAGAPTLVSIEEADAGLRMFQGNSQYRRTQIASVDSNQSWVNGTFPVSYSFTIADYPVDNPLNEFHMFLIPLNAVQGGGLNQFTDFSTASNNFRVHIAGGDPGDPTVVAELAYKTNLINSNPDQLALTLTNATAAGTWTLQFSSATAGTLTAPGASPAAFSIPAGVASAFADPVVAIFGVQPNGLDDIGSAVTLRAIQTVNVAGADIDSDFTTGAAIDTNIWLTASVSDDASNLLVVKPEDAWWLQWTFPDIGFGLGTKAELNSAVAWKTPGFYAGDTNAVFEKTLGENVSALIPQSGLPTLDGTPSGPASSSAFWRLENPAPAE